MAQSEPTACSIEKADGRSRADIQGLHRPADWNPQGRAESAMEHKPDYLRLSQAERERKEREEQNRA